RPAATASRGYRSQRSSAHSGAAMTHALRIGSSLGSAALETVSSAIRNEQIISSVGVALRAVGLPRILVGGTAIQCRLLASAFLGVLNRGFSALALTAVSLVRRLWIEDRVLFGELVPVDA